MSYTKLFSSIVTSTIWTEDDKTRIIWITMLALANKNGEVQASIPGLARVAGVSVSDCEVSVEKFLSPDPYSRTPDDQGRRIEKIEGGWALLNHQKYREMERGEDRKSKAAERKRRQREKESRNEKPDMCGNSDVTPNVTPLSQDVTKKRDNLPNVTPLSRQNCQAEAEAEADISKANTPLPPEGELMGLAKAIWNQFPRLGRERSSKAKLIAALKRIPAKDRPSKLKAIEAIKAWSSSATWTKDEGQFVRGCHLWVKDRQWEDLPEAKKISRGKFAGCDEQIEIPDLMAGKN